MGPHKAQREGNQLNCTCVLFQALQRAFHAHGISRCYQEVSYDYYLHFTNEVTKVQTG